MRAAYAVLTYLMLPIYAGYWFVRGFANRSYWEKISQRFGAGYPRPVGGCIWVHAVSVGEVQAAIPLVRALMERFPERHLMITTVTPTGAARVRRLFGDKVEHAYLPFETPHAVTNFFDATQPHIALVIETEIWPNLYRECGQRAVPLILVSARISPKSVQSYRKFLPLFRETLSHGIVIAAQSEADADRFKLLGAAPKRTWVTGNIKFDIEMPDATLAQGSALRRDNFEDRPVWVAASTHDREESQVLQAHRIVQREFPNAILVLIPRHPERFSAVRSMLHREGARFLSRTDGTPCTSDAEVYLVDTMGEVPLFYAASDIAFVGGTLVPVGGHNLLEPAALKKPVVTGPHLYNTQDIADKFSKVGASIVVDDGEQLGAAISRLFADQKTADEVGKRGFELVQQNRGALSRLLELIEPLMKKINE